VVDPGGGPEDGSVDGNADWGAEAADGDGVPMPAPEGGSEEEHEGTNEQERDALEPALEETPSADNPGAAAALGRAASDALGRAAQFLFEAEEPSPLLLKLPTDADASDARGPQSTRSTAELGDTDADAADAGSTPAGAAAALPWKQKGTPKARWCGGAPAAMLPWSPSSKAAAAAKRGGGGGGSKSDLAACMNTGKGAVNSCGAGAMKVAKSLPSIKALDSALKGTGGGVAKARSCAVVGNAGRVRSSLQFLSS